MWIARGDAMTRGSPFGLLAQIVRRTAACSTASRTGSASASSARASRAPCPRTSIERVAEFLGELARRARSPTTDGVQLRAARRDPQLLGDQVRRAWEDFVDAEAAVRPLVVVIEDLHWGDLPSVR